MKTFTKTKRLLCKADFDYVFKHANKIHCPPFIILYCKGQTNFARLGLVIGKKNVNKAWQRNRIRRIIRESFRQQQLPSYDIVLIAKRGADNYANQAIFKYLGTIWSRLNAVHG